jgi:hypothetical protein
MFRLGNITLRAGIWVSLVCFLVRPFPLGNSVAGLGQWLQWLVLAVEMAGNGWKWLSVASRGVVERSIDAFCLSRTE